MNAQNDQRAVDQHAAGDDERACARGVAVGASAVETSHACRRLRSSLRMQRLASFSSSVTNTMMMTR